MTIITPRQREAYERVKLMRQSYAEAGRQMGISKVAVWKLVKRFELTCANMLKIYRQIYKA